MSPVLPASAASYRPKSEKPATIKRVAYGLPTLLIVFHEAAAGCPCFVKGSSEWLAFLCTKHQPRLQGFRRPHRMPVRIASYRGRPNGAVAESQDISTGRRSCAVERYRRRW